MVDARGTAYSPATAATASSTAPEQCDLGSQNQANAYGKGACTTSCKNAPYCGDGRVQSPPEACDGQPNCDSTCQWWAIQSPYAKRNLPRIGCAGSPLRSLRERGCCVPYWGYAKSRGYFFSKVTVKAAGWSFCAPKPIRNVPVLSPKTLPSAAPSCTAAHCLPSGLRSMPAGPTYI